MYRRILSTLLALCIVLGMLPISALAVEQDTPTISVHAEDVWDGTIADSYAGGSGTSQAPYLIATAEQLARVAEQVNSGAESGRNYRLLNDIYLNDVSAVSSWDVTTPQNQWIPIGSASSSFSGIFDGADHAIQGIYISTADNYQGLFGVVGKDSSIKNLSVEKSYIKGGDYVSGICGYSSSSFSNCHNAATVDGNKYISGIIGGAGNPGGLFGGSPVNLENCSNIGKVTGQSYVGGVLGNADTGVLKKCYNVGAVTGTNRVGGIAGRSVETHYCWNLGDITGADYTGGILGEAAFFGSDQSKVLNCFNAGAIKGKSYTGGIVGYASAYSFAYKADINNCYNVGTINADGDYVAGIAGSSNRNRVKNCYNAGICVFGNGLNSDAVFNVANSAGNLFYLAGCCGDSYSNYWDTVEEMNASEMQESAFVSTLNNGGSAWFQDTENYNSGYPILSGIDYDLYKQYIQAEPPNGEITLDIGDEYTMPVGSSEDITASIPNGSNLKKNDIKLDSHDESIVSLVIKELRTEDDILYLTITVTGIVQGRSRITVSTSDGRKTACEITVSYQVKPRDYVLQLGEVRDESVNGLLDTDLTLTSDDITWVAEDNSIVTVEPLRYTAGENSLYFTIKGTSIGTTMVTCFIKGIKQASCSVRVELDRWPFSNTSTDEGGKWPAENGYYISSADYCRLIGKLSPTEVAKITYANSLVLNYNIDTLLMPTPFYKKWNGSCYGMSIWVCLVGSDILSPERIGSETLYKATDLSKNRQSAINYFHYQQMLPNVVKQVDQFMSLPQEDQLNQLKNIAENSQTPYIIRYEFEQEIKTGIFEPTAHAVVGYKLETGCWPLEINGVADIYTNKIVLYDCSNTLNIGSYDLYFNEKNWCIPGRYIISQNNLMSPPDNNGRLKLVTDDLTILNAVDYVSGEKTYDKPISLTTLSAPSNAVYSIDSSNNTYIVNGLSAQEVNGNNSLNVILDDNLTATNEITPSIATVILPDDNSEYTIKSY